MRVLYVAHTAEPYGATRSLWALLRAAPNLGIEPFVAVQQDGELVRWLERARIGHVVVEPGWWAAGAGGADGRWRRTCAAARAARSVARSAARTKFDLVHSNSVATVAGALAARRLGLPHVWHLREFGSEDWRLEWDFGFERVRRSVRGAAVTIASSAALHRHFLDGAPCARRPLIYDGVGSAAEIARRPLPAIERGADFTFVLSGLVAVNKGQESAVRAFARATRGGAVPARLELLGGGDPDYQARCEALAAAAGVGERVRFRGHLEEPLAAVARAHVALMCSPAEAFGRVTAEAMSCGLPVIGFAGGATPEIVTDGVDGLLYGDGEHAGDEQALAAAMSRLLEAPELAARLGATAHRTALARFTDERYAAEVAATYRSLLDGPRPAAVQSPSAA